MPTSPRGQSRYTERAVRKDSDMAKTLCISADSHVVEPPELFAPLQKRFGERAPHIRYTEDRGPQLDLGDGRLGLAIGGFLQAGFDFGRPDAREQLKRGY